MLQQISKKFPQNLDVYEFCSYSSLTISQIFKVNIELTEKTVRDSKNDTAVFLN